MNQIEDLIMKTKDNCKYTEVIETGRSKEKTIVGNSIFPNTLEESISIIIL